MVVPTLIKPAVIFFVFAGLAQTICAQQLNDRDYVIDVMTVCRMGFDIHDQEQAERRFAHALSMEQGGKNWIGEYMLREVHAYYRSVYRFDSAGSLGVKSARKLDSLTDMHNQRLKKWIMGEWKWLEKELTWPNFPAMKASSNSIVFSETKMKFIRNDSILWEHDYFLKPGREGRWIFTYNLEIPAMKVGLFFDFDYWAKTDRAPRMLYISALNTDEKTIPGFYQKVEYW